MAYEHKKSVRTVTDVQMSDGTSVDGSRIDRALDETTERFNNLEPGDFSERFAKTQFVFGMQPSPIVGAPNSTGATPYGNITNILSDAKTRPTSGQWLPWLPIINNETTAHATATGNYPETYNAAGFTPTGGFQNKWRFKGTNVEGRPDNLPESDPPPVLSRAMEFGTQWESDGWGDCWAGAATTPYDDAVQEPAPQSSYQFAWSHSWEFTKPVIIDDIMLFVRTDRPWTASTSKYQGLAGTTPETGWYDAPYQYIQTAAVAPTQFIFSTRDVMFQLSVDNEFSKEKRNLNDIEATFNSRPMDGWRVGQEGTVGITYSDMLPNAPGYNTGTGVGDGLEGRMIRFSNLNIPIRQMARVRLSVILPWYHPITSVANHQDQVKMSRGMSPSRWDAELNSPTNTSKTLENAPTGHACLLGAPWDNCSINGCLTVLEDVES